MFTKQATYKYFTHTIGTPIVKVFIQYRLASIVIIN